VSVRAYLAQQSRKSTEAELHKRGLVRVDLPRRIAVETRIPAHYISDTKAYYPAWVLPLWEQHSADWRALVAALEQARDSEPERLLLVSVMRLEGRYSHLALALQAIVDAARRA
jgi:hypothetical protein